MKDVLLSDISILQMQIFITAAEKLNYTQTAEICHVTQPTVSRSIAALESTLGLILFYKQKNVLKLTPAGKSLHDSFVATLHQLSHGIHKSALLQEGFRDLIRISFPSEVSPAFIQDYSRNFRKTNPAIKIHFSVYQQINNSLQDLEDSLIDILISHYFNLAEIAAKNSLQYKVLTEVPLKVFMLPQNKLATKDFLTYSDLKTVRLLAPYPEERMYMDIIANGFRNIGAVPRISSYISSGLEGLINLSDENEVFIADEFAAPLPSKNFIGIPLKGTTSGLICVYRKIDCSTIIEDVCTSMIDTASSASNTLH